MFERFLVSLSLVIFFSSSAFANRSEEFGESHQLSIKRMAQNFYLKQAQAEALRNQFSKSAKLGEFNTLSLQSLSCDPDDSNGPSCVGTLCKYTHCSGSTGREIAEACSGSDGQCVQELCKTTHCSGSTGREVARSCAGR